MRQKPALATSTSPGIVIGITDGICPNAIIQVGDQVTWTNQGKSEHIVKDITNEDTPLFDSGILIPGDSFTFTFTEPMSFSYACLPDGTMNGMISVNP